MLAMLTFWGRAIWYRLRREERGGIDDYVAKVVMILVVVLGIAVVVGANQKILGRLDSLVEDFMTGTNPDQNPYDGSTN